MFLYNSKVLVIGYITNDNDTMNWIDWTKQADIDNSSDLSFLHTQS